LINVLWEEGSGSAVGSVWKLDACWISEVLGYESMKSDAHVLFRRREQVLEISGAGRLSSHDEESVVRGERVLRSA